MSQNPVLCSAISLVSFGDWAATEKVFAPCQKCQLHQAWRTEPEPAFLPATVQFGWSEKTLYLYAVLQDRDIFNAATGLNQQTWTMGDALELFLQTPNTETYFELHVTPENNRLQLRLPSADAVNSEGDWTQWHVREPLFESRTEINETRENWRVLMALDMPLLLEGEIFKAAKNWKFSVSRYDWTRGSNEPVLSSTSPHRVSGFHRQHEWRSLVFEADKKMDFDGSN